MVQNNIIKNHKAEGVGWDITYSVRQKSIDILATRAKSWWRITSMQHNTSGQTHNRHIRGPFKHEINHHCHQYQTSVNALVCVCVCLHVPVHNPRCVRVHSKLYHSVYCGEEDFLPIHSIDGTHTHTHTLYAILSNEFVAKVHHSGK